MLHLTMNPASTYITSSDLLALRTVQAVCLRCPALTVQTRSAHPLVYACRIGLGAFLKVQTPLIRAGYSCAPVSQNADRAHRPDICQHKEQTFNLYREIP